MSKDNPQQPSMESPTKKRKLSTSKSPSITQLPQQTSHSERKINNQENETPRRLSYKGRLLLLGSARKPKPRDIVTHPFNTVAQTKQKPNGDSLSDAQREIQPLEKWVDCYLEDDEDSEEEAKKTARWQTDVHQYRRLMRFRHEMDAKRAETLALKQKAKDDHDDEDEEEEDEEEEEGEDNEENEKGDKDGEDEEEEEGEDDEENEKGDNDGEDEEEEKDDEENEKGDKDGEDEEEKEKEEEEKEEEEHDVDGPTDNGNRRSKNEDIGLNSGVANANDSQIFDSGHAEAEDHDEGDDDVSEVPIRFAKRFKRYSWSWKPDVLITRKTVLDRDRLVHENRLALVAKEPVGFDEDKKCLVFSEGRWFPAVMVKQGIEFDTHKIFVKFPRKRAWPIHGYLVAEILPFAEDIDDYRLDAAVFQRNDPLLHNYKLGKEADKYDLVTFCAGDIAFVLGNNSYSKTLTVLCKKVEMIICYTSVTKLERIYDYEWHIHEFVRSNQTQEEFVARLRKEHNVDEVMATNHMPKPAKAVSLSNKSGAKTTPRSRSTARRSSSSPAKKATNTTSQRKYRSGPLLRARSAALKLNSQLAKPARVTISTPPMPPSPPRRFNRRLTDGMLRKSPSIDSDDEKAELDSQLQYQLEKQDLNRERHQLHLAMQERAEMRRMEEMRRRQYGRLQSPTTTVISAIENMQQNVVSAMNRSSTDMMSFIRDTNNQAVDSLTTRQKLQLHEQMQPVLASLINNSSNVSRNKATTPTTAGYAEAWKTLKEMVEAERRREDDGRKSAKNLNQTHFGLMVTPANGASQLGTTQPSVQELMRFPQTFHQPTVVTSSGGGGGAKGLAVVTSSGSGGARGPVVVTPSGSGGGGAKGLAVVTPSGSGGAKGPTVVTPSGSGGAKGPAVVTPSGSGGGGVTHYTPKSSGASSVLAQSTPKTSIASYGHRKPSALSAAVRLMASRNNAPKRDASSMALASTELPFPQIFRSPTMLSRSPSTVTSARPLVRSSQRRRSILTPTTHATLSPTTAARGKASQVGADFEVEGAQLAQRRSIMAEEELEENGALVMVNAEELMKSEKDNRFDSGKIKDALDAHPHCEVIATGHVNVGGLRITAGGTVFFLKGDGFDFSPAMISEVISRTSSSAEGLEEYLVEFINNAIGLMTEQLPPPVYCHPLPQRNRKESSRHVHERYPDPYSAIIKAALQNTNHSLTPTQVVANVKRACSAVSDAMRRTREKLRS